MPVIDVSILGNLKSVRGVPGLATIALGHPDGFNTFSVTEADQIANSSVSRDKTFPDLRPANLESRLSQTSTEGLRQGRNLVEAANSLPIKGFGQLLPPKRGLLVFHSETRKFLKIKA
jgi:hypothetical protein